MIVLKGSLLAVIGGAALLETANAFVPRGLHSTTSPRPAFSTAVSEEVEKQLGKPTGTSFLPEETIERAKKGSPVEKVKLAKDGTSAFVDVYEYAKKFRSAEMTWEEVEKADLDSVSFGGIPWTDGHDSHLLSLDVHILLDI